MGKQGPCYHCGVTSTPLWRNGPPDKPILCNACGSRWRTKGSLVNYTPLHARSEPDEFEDRRVSKVKAMSIKNKEAKLLKRKDEYQNVLGGGLAPSHYNQSLFKGLDEDTSNRSSSGSARSNSDSCMQLGSTDASDLTGPSQSSIVWDTTVPSRKRTCVSRPKQSPVEQLTRDLHTILHEQQSCVSGSSEEDLIFESVTPMVSVEIGHGSVLIRHPNTAAREEESEASSLSVETKNEACPWFTTPPVHNANKTGQFQIEMSGNQEQNNRDNDEKSPILVNHDSPLCKIDLKDIINFAGFASQMTNDEQQRLVKYLPSIDTVQLPDSLKNMFDSLQFKENLLSFQRLVAQGTFDPSPPATKDEGSRALKKLALCNTTKSKWVEQYNLLQDMKCKNDSGASAVSGVRGYSVDLQRSNQFSSFPGTKSTSKKPKELVDNNFSPRSLFALPSDKLDYVEDSSDHDLLLDVPSNTSFPLAELLPVRISKEGYVDK